MDLIDEAADDFQSSKPLQSKQNAGVDYQYNMSCLQRRTFFAHANKTLGQIKFKIQKTGDKGSTSTVQNLGIQDLPNIKARDDAILLAKQGNQILKDLLLEQEDQKNEVTPFLLLKLIIRQHKTQIAFIIFCYALEIFPRLLFSIILQSLFTKVARLDEGDNLRQAYLIIIGYGLVWLIAQGGKHNGFYESAYLVGRIRSMLVFMIYAKLSKISQYTAKSQQLGKIINLISNDFNSLQADTPILLISVLIPFALAGIVTILYFRFGWPGMLIVAVLVAFVPLQALVGKMNGTILQKVNVHKDMRVKVCAEIIQGIKFIKIYGWEIAFKHIIQAIRQEQIKDYIKLAFGKALQKSLGNVAATIAGLVCFVAIDIYGFGTGLTNAKIFATLELMGLLKLIIPYLSISFGFMFELRIIFHRFCTILNIQDKRMIQIDQATKLPVSKNKISPTVQKGQIYLKDLNVYWKTDQLTTPTLININLRIFKNKFVGVTGKVGSGKSGLLAVLLDEAPYYSGSILKNGTIAYVQQEPIIFSASLKDNILFGSQFDQMKYRLSIQMSCLQADLAQLEAGDQTMIGEKGVTLSGGQKARLSFARALYFDADIYLLDDPISAVDSKVARRLYENAILKLKGRKTIILVTHQVAYLQNCDEIVIMDEGEIQDHNTPNNLKEKLAKLESPDENNYVKTEGLILQADTFSRQTLRKPQKTQQKLQGEQSISKNQAEEDVDITCSSYTKYLFYSKLSYLVFPSFLLFLLVSESANMIYFRLLSQYDNLKQGASNPVSRTMVDFWTFLGLLIVGYFVLSVIKYFLINFGILNVNKAIHKDMIHGLVRSKSSYFDVTPTGRLNSRFSNDLGILDYVLFNVLIDSVQGPIINIILIANVVSIDIYFLIPGILNIAIVAYALYYCKSSIIAIKQLDLRLKSPVYNMVSEMITGLIQIKIFKRRSSLMCLFSQKLNQIFRANLCYESLTRTFGANCSYITVIFMWIGWMIGLFIVKPQTAGLYGVTVVCLGQFIDFLQWHLRQIIVLQSIMVSAERALTIAKLTPEKELRTRYDQQNGIGYESFDFQEESARQLEHEVAQKEWPSSATIRLQNFSMRYRPELPLVLRNINLYINSKQKIGIVGRTGAGKSSIVQALFRIYEPESQSVYQIGGLNSWEMGLHSLRQNISVIPQTPFLFKGTIKKNLDPFEKKSQSELWQALKESNLQEVVQKMPNKLQTDITNLSQVFSVGQKQLLCLARALLRKNKFLVLDQATSNVDMVTDHFIQTCIKTKFQDTTVITIAHRLNTIADYDRIIVIDKGQIVEIGSPHELIVKDGVFAQMVNHTGRNAHVIRNIAKQAQLRIIN